MEQATPTNRAEVTPDQDGTYTVTLRFTDMDTEDIASLAAELDANQWAYHAELLRNAQGQS